MHKTHPNLILDMTPLTLTLRDSVYNIFFHNNIQVVI